MKFEIEGLCGLAEFAKVWMRRGGNTTGRECVPVGGKPPPRSLVSYIGRASPTALRCGKPQEGGKWNRYDIDAATKERVRSVSKISDLKFEIRDMDPKPEA